LILSKNIPEFHTICKNTS